MTKLFNYRQHVIVLYEHVNIITYVLTYVTHV